MKSCAPISFEPAGMESLLYSFAGGSNDGAAVFTPLIQSSDGNLY
jgi:hypothetical protein